jgi:hypothetical protein
MNKQMFEEKRVFLFFFPFTKLYFQPSNEGGNVYFLLRQSLFFFILVYFVSIFSIIYGRRTVINVLP